MIKAKFWVHSGGPLSRWELNCLILKTVPRLAQLEKRRSAERYVAGSNPGRTNTQGLKINEENVLPLLWVFSDKNEKP